MEIVKDVSRIIGRRVVKINKWWNLCWKCKKWQVIIQIEKTVAMAKVIRSANLQ